MKKEMWKVLFCQPKKSYQKNLLSCVSSSLFHFNFFGGWIFLFVLRMKSYDKWKKKKYDKRTKPECKERERKKIVSIAYIW